MKPKTKQLIIFEMAVALSMLFFVYDLLPRNYTDFDTICSQAWANDRKQYEMCMLPYHKQKDTSKKALAVLGLILVAVPIHHSRSNNKK